MVFCTGGGRGEMAEPGEDFTVFEDRLGNLPGVVPPGRGGAHGVDRRVLFLKRRRSSMRTNGVHSSLRDFSLKRATAATTRLRWDDVKPKSALRRDRRMRCEGGTAVFIDI